MDIGSNIVILFSFFCFNIIIFLFYKKYNKKQENSTTNIYVAR